MANFQNVNIKVQTSSSSIAAKSATPIRKQTTNMENTPTGKQAAIAQKKLIPHSWAEYGDGPQKRGDYNIKVQSKDGREKTITAWHNPGNGHWLADGKECGYVDIITPPGETEEWRITHWQNVHHETRDE